MKLNYRITRKVFISALFFVSISNHAIAQKDYNNSIKLSFTNFIFPGLGYEGVDPILADQLGIFYEHRVYKHWRLIAGYSMFNTYETDGLSSALPGPSVSDFKEYTGQGTTRHQYKMIDLLLAYRLNVLKRHKISFGIGPSYTWGKNINDDYSLVMPAGKDYNASYWGVAPAISYDYVFLRNRLSIGMDLRVRKYFGWPSEQIDYGLHLGVNF